LAAVESQAGGGFVALLHIREGQRGKNIGRRFAV
jgi:hypothetical protein